MATYLLKKSYQHKDLKEVNFKSLWDTHGIFTTMWIFNRPNKILFFKQHIKNLIKSLKFYNIKKTNLEKNIIKLIKNNRCEELVEQDSNKYILKPNIFSNLKGKNIDISL